VVAWLFPLALCCGLFLVGGCRTFNRDWANAEKTPVASRGILGRWEGTWSSEVNGHNGKLRCLVTLKDSGSYKARFHAIYRKVIGFGYTVPLGITETNGVLEFRGKANLGWWAGGVYQYEGHVQGDDFFSTYLCKYDHGIFQMTRHK
jgi:hypothetical protein